MNNPVFQERISQKIYFKKKKLFHLILYSQSDFDLKKKEKWSKRKNKTCHIQLDWSCSSLKTFIGIWIVEKAGQLRWLRLNWERRVLIGGGGRDGQFGAVDKRRGACVDRKRRSVFAAECESGLKGLTEVAGLVGEAGGGGGGARRHLDLYLVLGWLEWGLPLEVRRLWRDVGYTQRNWWRVGWAGCCCFQCKELDGELFENFEYECTDLVKNLIQMVYCLHWKFYY